MPEVGFRKLFARPDQVPGLKSAGAAEFALRLALPSVAEVGEALDYGLSLGVDGTAVREQLATVKAKLTSPIPGTGFTITVRKSETVDLDIPVDQALQFVVSCGVVVPESETQHINAKIAEAIAERSETVDGVDGVVAR